MIDRQNRDALEHLLAFFAQGTIPTAKFREKLEQSVSEVKTEDNAIQAIVAEAYSFSAGWTGSVRDRLEIARWLLFLRSNLEYEWPIHAVARWDDKVQLGGIWYRALNLLTAGGFHSRRRDQLVELEQHSGERGRWPFFRESDFEEAIAKKPE